MRLLPFTDHPQVEIARLRMETSAAPQAAATTTPPDSSEETEALRGEVAKLTEQCRSLEFRADELSRSHTDLLAEHERLQEAVRRAEGAAEDAESRAGALDARAVELEADLQAAKSKVEELQRHLETAEQASSKSERELTVLRAKHEATQRMLDAMRAEVASLSGQSRGSTPEKSESPSSAWEASSSPSCAAPEGDAESRVFPLEGRMPGLSLGGLLEPADETGDAPGIARTLERELEEARAELSRAREELEAAKAREQEMKRSDLFLLGGQERRAVAARDRVAELEGELEAARAELGRTERERDLAAGEADAAREVIEELERNAEATQEGEQVLREELRRAREQMEKVESEAEAIIDRKEEEIRALREAIEGAEQAREAVAAEARMARAEMDAMAALCDEAEGRVVEAVSGSAAELERHMDFRSRVTRFCGDVEKLIDLFVALRGRSAADVSALEAAREREADWIAEKAMVRRGQVSLYPIPLYV